MVIFAPKAPNFDKTEVENHLPAATSTIGTRSSPSNYSTIADATIKAPRVWTIYIDLIDNQQYVLEKSDYKMVL